MATTAAHSIRAQLERLLRIQPQAKPRLYAEVFEGSDLASLNYWLELIFSAGIATLGLVLNSPAVVIGAMLISPLMGPLMAAGLALAAADLYLGLKALVNLVASVAGAVVLSALLVWLLPFHAPTTEILNRTQPNLLDLGVALFSGLAGSIVVCRGGTGGGVTALPGVAIAVALMPPLCTVGFGVGSGFQGSIIYGAGLLFLTNLAAIIASAFAVFFAVRMDAADVRAEVERSIREHAVRDRLYHILQRTGLIAGVAQIGKLRWRILMVVAALAILYLPLRRGLMEVRDETVARSAVREAIRRIAPPDAVVAEQVRVGPARIRVHLIVTEPVDPARTEEARSLVMKRTGKDVELTVRKVAGEEELALLRERLARRAPQPAPPPDLESVAAEWTRRLQQAINEIWPAAVLPLVDYELVFAPQGPLVRIRYESPAPVGPVGEELMVRALRSALGHAALRVEWIRQPPARESARRSK